jgi:hypothetical protein
VFGASPSVDAFLLKAQLCVSFPSTTTTHHVDILLLLELKYISHTINSLPYLSRRNLNQSIATMISINKQFLFGCIVAFATFQNKSYAFAPTITTSPRTVVVATALEAHRDAPRRDFFNTLKRVVLGAGTAAVLNKNAPAFAEEATSGKIVEMQIANLGGEVGKTGTVRIQMRPEWAPRGVSRFEVRFLFCCRFFDSCTYSCTNLFFLPHRNLLRVGFTTIAAFSVFYLVLFLNLESTDLLV